MEAGRQDREQEGEEVGDKHGGARKAGKVRDKKENWKERGDKKDAWKERRRKERPPEPEAGPGAPRREAEAAAPEDKNPRGNALLSMLKANPPSTTRYSREELLSIGQLPASRVKPPALCVIIDKENGASPLLVKPKVDKVSRRRGGDGEEDEGEEDGRRERRERAPRAERGGRSDGEDETADARRPGGRRPGERWKDEDRRPPKGRHEDAGAELLGAHPHHGQADGGWGKAAEPQWDMPDASAAQGDLADFTLGDIRKAEKSLSGGMSMKDYKASLRAGGAPEPAGEAGARDRDDPFQVEGGGEGAFFVEEEAEDEDVSRASRGFGKWFGSRPEGAAVGAAAWGGGALQPSATVHPTGTSRPSEPHPVPSSASVPAGAHSAEDVTTGSNQMGRSILSMLGRAEASSSAPAPGSEAAVPAPDRQGKLSVAELFHLAQGKELPPIPSTAARREELAEAEAPERRAQREALQVAQYMWAAAAKAQQPQQPGGRFPGYHATGPCSGSAAAPAFGGAGRGVGAGAGPGEQLLHEAYAQAMLGMGQAPWGSPMPQGCPPFSGARGYGPPQPYGPYGLAPGYPAAARGPGFEGYPPVGPGALQQPGGAAPQRPKAPAEKPPAAAQGRQAAAAQGAEAPPKLPLGAGIEEAGEDDAGCSQS